MSRDEIRPGQDTLLVWNLARRARRSTSGPPASRSARHGHRARRVPGRTAGAAPVWERSPRSPWKRSYENGVPGWRAGSPRGCGGL